MKEKLKIVAQKNKTIANLITQCYYYKSVATRNFNKNIIDAIDKYISDDKKNDLSYKKKLYKDILREKIVFGFTNYKEYFMFDFEHRSEQERREFVPSNEYSKIWDNLNVDLTNNKLIDKYEAYCALKKYYKRDIIKVEAFEDYQKFVEFVNKHKTFIIKEINGSLGHNIFKVDLENNDIKTIFFKILQIGNCVVEECIEQSKEMAIFHPQSVNTVRVATFYNNDKICKIYAMFRMGRGGNTVDNASSGGIAVAVDLQTGTIMSDGRTKKGERFDYHPDSNVKLRGTQLPRWNDLMNTIDELVLQFPEYKLIGWDMALTDDGWVVVEGNNRPNINTIQMCLGRGLRKEINSTIGSF
jgi:hypothetical protein